VGALLEELRAGWILTLPPISSPGTATTRRQICVVTTSPLIVRFFLIPHLRRLAGEYAVALAVNTDDPGFLRAYGLEIEVIPIAIERPIALLRDLAALVSLIWLFRARRFDAVHSFSPKGGLLAMLAARVANVPVRLHTFTGQVWANREGIGRALLKSADRITARCATQTFADSVSQRDFIHRERVLPAGQRCLVLGSGSISGVNLARFHPDPSARAAVRREFGIADDDVLIAYVGRLARDKGVLDLAHAFASIDAGRADCHLLLVGPDEDALTSEVRAILGTRTSRLHVHGYTDVPERFLAAADILCLPSYREGFGTVIIEAGACGIPAIASRIYGVVDALVDGKTGLLHEPGQTAEIAKHLDRLASDIVLRRRLGAAARDRVKREFAEERVVGALADYYAGVLRASPSDAWR
jgi:glycosyltransferase involved in cell wall biosynthesis